jgi:leucyl/phenylalanyl-tRNA--protein transferase
MTPPPIDDHLKPELLLQAYRLGLFPMAEPDGQVYWYSPDPRAVIELDRFHVPRSLAQRCRQGRCQMRINSAFQEVIHACADRGEDTWISTAIIDAYLGLHRMGYAHSDESWQEDRLVGGLYGVAIGGAFFGESMFHRTTDASKVALVWLVERLKDRQFCLLDVQFLTEHLARFGARHIPRPEYLRRLDQALARDCKFAD